MTIFQLFQRTIYPLLRDSSDITCYFDSKTKNYVGAKFHFDIEVKDYFTLEKLHLLEQKLSQASINTGITNLLEPEKDYFTLHVGIYLGQQ